MLAFSPLSPQYRPAPSASPPSAPRPPITRQPSVVLPACPAGPLPWQRVGAMAAAAGGGAADEGSLRALYRWVDAVPLSRPRRNIARDFSDGGVRGSGAGLGLGGVRASGSGPGLKRSAGLGSGLGFGGSPGLGVRSRPKEELRHRGQGQASSPGSRLKAGPGLRGSTGSQEESRTHRSPGSGPGLSGSAGLGVRAGSWGTQASGPGPGLIARLGVQGRPRLRSKPWG